MKQLLIKLKKAWVSLPVKAKKIYKLTIAIFIISSFYLYSTFSGPPSETLLASANIAKNVPETLAKDGAVEIDYQQKIDLNKQEESLAEESRSNGETYVPNFQTIDAKTGDEDGIRLDQSLPEEMPKPESTNVAPKSKERTRQPQELRGERSEEMTRMIEARVGAYAQIISSTKESKGVGTFYTHYKAEVQNAAAETLPVSDGTYLNASGERVMSPEVNQLTPGDVIMAKIDNYINSDKSSKFVRLTGLEGDLEGATIMASYERVEGVIIITTSTISKGGITRPMTGVVVSADGKMETGLSTDTDNHTLYRWSALVFSGALKGAGEFYLASSDEVITDNGNVIKVNERDPLDVVFGVAKGIGDATADIAKNEFNIPPTVIVDPEELSVVGIMLTQEASAPFFTRKIRDFVY